MKERQGQAPPPLPEPELLPPNPSCDRCQELSRQLGVAIDALNKRGCAKYGDVLHTNFALEQRVR